MKKVAKKKPKPETAVAKGSYAVVQMPDCWIAHISGDAISGFLLYNKTTQKYHAWASEIYMAFPKLAKAPYKCADDCPVNEDHNPKSDFLFLLALRKRFKEHAPGSEFVARSWRELAFRQRRSEAERRKGKALSESNWAHCMKIARSKELFEDYVAKWLMHIVCGDRASETLRRFSKWLEKAEDIESEFIPRHYEKFLAAVEAAAMESQGVPKKKDVQAIYEKEMSANQLGKGHGFRDVMRQLRFEWLPVATRGRDSKPKKSGIR